MNVVQRSGGVSFGLALVLLAGCGPQPQVVAFSGVCNLLQDDGTKQQFDATLTALVEGPEGATVSIGYRPCGQGGTPAFSTECTDWTHASNSSCTRSKGVAEQGQLRTHATNFFAPSGSSVQCDFIADLTLEGTAAAPAEGHKEITLTCPAP